MTWNGKKVSVVLPTYNEKDSIRESIDEFFASGVVDEVIVINNNAAPGTSEEVAKTRAREVMEPRQGFGSATRRGFEEASGDLIILSEPDGTFLGADVVKLLAYSNDFDVVLGTRTSRELIWQGANMGFLLKWANVGLATIVELVFNTTMLTDVGCTMRLMTRSAYQKVREHFTVYREHFNFEFLLLVIYHRIRFIEIPVNYRSRVGVSSVTGNLWVAAGLGMKMFLFMLDFLAKRSFRRRAP